MVTTTKGMTSDSSELANEATCSPAATMGFPVPAVKLVEASLAKTVPP